MKSKNKKMNLPLATMPLESLLPTKSHPGPGIRLCCGRATANGSKLRLVTLVQTPSGSTQFNLIQPNSTQFNHQFRANPCPLNHH
jgi:hypothetical protein